MILSLLLSVVTCSYTQQDYQNDSNGTLLWGAYRPNLYVGIRPRLPDSFMAGLMWANVDGYNDFVDLRHACEQGDDIASYGWEQYDARNGGRHIVRDIKMGVDIQTELVKIPSGRHGGSWGLRIRGTPRPDAPQDLSTTVIFYAGLDGEGTIEHADVAFEDIATGIPGSAKLRGEAPDLGAFDLKITPGPSTNTHPASTHKLSKLKDMDRWSFLSSPLPKGEIWQVREFLLSTMRKVVEKISEVFGRDDLPDPALLYTLPNSAGPESNLHLFQKTFVGSFEFDVLYTSAEAELTSEDVSEMIKRNDVAFSERFDEVFKLAAPFDTAEYKDFAKVLFSNLLGGIGYFQGTSIVDRSYAGAYDEDEEMFWESASAQLAASHGAEEGPSELFTSVPSRAFFPRGFYWDEGFHLMPIGLWDQDLSLEIISSWFSLVDEDGWIAREQILGPEARSKVPREFTTQYPHYANPPTLFIAIDHFLSRLRSARSGYTAEFQQVLGTNPIDSKYLHDDTLSRQFLTDLYPKLKKHYDLFRRTQQGEIKAYDREAFSKKEGYRWRGRTPDHCLTSGLDDYPRARPPHPGELHVDLHCWMTLMTKLLKNIAEQVGEDEDASVLARNEEALSRNLIDLHWSEHFKTFADQTIDDYAESAPVVHLGYISIFPVLLGLLPPDSHQLGHVLNLMRNEDHLWSPYGLRSLSKSDVYYGTGENYWKGPVWINMNYLALSSLYRNYIFVEGPYQGLAKKIYTELRENVVQAIYEEYQKTGIFWEQYNPETGRGQRTKGFTGWTSCAVNIMAEAY